MCSQTPMVVAEAMLRGVPVITTDIAGVPEMLDHEVSTRILG